MSAGGDLAASVDSTKRAWEAVRIAKATDTSAREAVEHAKTRISEVKGVLEKRVVVDTKVIKDLTMDAMGS